MKLKIATGLVQSFFKKIAFNLSLILFLGLIFIQTGCKKFIEVGAPTTSINAENVYQSDATAIAVMNGIYTNMSKSPSFATPYGSFIMPQMLGLMSDEMSLFSGVNSPVYIGYYTNAMVPTLDFHFWNSIYPLIYECNAALEGLAAATALSANVKKQLTGEAKFVRAFCYFYLVNLYGDVPLALGTDYKKNAALSKSPKAVVYAQIVADLTDAQNLLSSNYLSVNLTDLTNERVRPTKWAATALLARTFLFTGDWAKAETQATSLINNSTSYNLPSILNNVFLRSSKEAIWQLQPVTKGQNTLDARVFILPATGPNYTFTTYLSNTLVNAFETGDQRKLQWVDSVTTSTATFYYPFKYKVNMYNAPLSEYTMVLRLGEQFLIRAEARAQQANLTGAADDLNAIRVRAGLMKTTAATQSDLLKAILHERQVELFAEWGNRWFDLIRTKNIDAQMGIIAPRKGGTWSSYKQLLPIPYYEVLHNPNLNQNEGYN